MYCWFLKLGGMKRSELFVFILTLVISFLWEVQAVLASLASSVLFINFDHRALIRIKIFFFL